MNDVHHIAVKDAELHYLNQVKDLAVSKPGMFESSNTSAVRVERKMPASLHTLLEKTAKGNLLGEQLLCLAALQICAHLYGFGEAPLIACPPLKSTWLGKMRQGLQTELPEAQVKEVQFFRTIVGKAVHLKAVLEGSKQQLLSNSRKAYPVATAFHQRLASLYPEAAEAAQYLAFRHAGIHLPFDAASQTYLQCTVEAGVFYLEAPQGQVAEEILSQFAEAWAKVLHGLLDQPTSSIRDLDWMPETVREISIAGYETTQYPVDAGLSVPELFQTIALQETETIALNFYGREMTYGELLKIVREFAVLMREKYQLVPGQIAAVLVDRDESMVISMMACLWLGVVYLPMDRTWPDKRLHFILENSEAALLITDSMGAKRMTDISTPTAVVGNAWASFRSESASLAPFIPKRDTAAYAIYTSGTTGTPKGMLQTHRCLSNLIQWNIAIFQLKKQRILQSSAIAFDASIQECLLALLSGSTLYFIGYADKLDPESAAQFIQENEISIFWLPISLLNRIFGPGSALLDRHSISDLVGTGEQLKVGPDLHHFLSCNPEVRLHNFYGPSETHVITSHFLSGAQDNLAPLPPIGQPLPNTQLYLKNAHGHLLPPGIWGELYAGGANVALGYIDLPAQTAASFSLDPARPGARIYQTGDIVRWDENGVLHYAGRIDKQVKIRGFRIELGEIEKVLMTHPQVSNTMVLVHEDEAKKVLQAYVQSREQLQAEDLRAFLSAHLPNYMIPAHLFSVPTFPLNANGKVDRKKLISMAQEMESGVTYAAPQNEVEIKVVRIWQAVLQLPEAPGIHHNFFDLGGHSLLALKLLSRIRDAFKVRVPLWQLFEDPTPAGLARVIPTLERAVQDALPAAPVLADYPLSSQQLSMYLAAVAQPNSLAYAVPYIARLRGKFDHKSAERAFQALLQRHAILRVAIFHKDGEIRQEVREISDFRLALRQIEPADVATATAAFFQAFDLKHPPLMHAAVFQVGPEDHYLLVNFHHIITDGAGVAVLVRDFMQLYAGSKLPPLERQYFDYAWQQQAERTSAAYQQQGAYWKQQLAGQLPVSRLPYDHAGQEGERQGKTLHFSWKPAASQELRQAAKNLNMTPFSWFLATYFILLHKYSLQEDILIGSPTAGRKNPTLENMGGLMLNTLVFRSKIQPDMLVKEYLQEVQQLVWKGLEYQDYPFVDLVRDLNLPNRRGRSPLIDCWFDFHNQTTTQMVMPGLEIEEQAFESGAAKFDIALLVEDEPERFLYRIEYDTGLFTEATIYKFSRQFDEMALMLTQNSDVRIMDLRLEVPAVPKPQSPTQTSYNF